MPYPLAGITLGLSEVGRVLGVFVPEGGGGMSVLRTRNVFFLGFGASLSLVSCICAELTCGIFRHVETTKEHDGFLAIIAPFRNKGCVGVEQSPEFQLSSILGLTTCEELTSITLPQPPKRSFPHP